MHRPYRDLQNLKFSCLYLFPFSHKVVPQKASGGGRGGVVYHTSTGQYIGVATFFFFFFFFFFVSGLKLDEKSIENGLVGQKFLVVCLFWGGCHHPNYYFRILLRACQIYFRSSKLPNIFQLPWKNGQNR